MQNNVIRIFAKLRLRMEKLVELRRSRLWRNITEKKTQLPTREGRKTKVKKKMMTTLSSNVNRHFGEAQSDMVLLESVVFISTLVLKSPSRCNIEFCVQLEKMFV